jgi:hypothetical protein
MLLRIIYVSRENKRKFLFEPSLLPQRKLSLTTSAQAAPTINQPTDQSTNQPTIVQWRRKSSVADLSQHSQHSLTTSFRFWVSFQELVDKVVICRNLPEKYKNKQISLGGTSPEAETTSKLKREDT